MTITPGFLAGKAGDSADGDSWPSGKAECAALYMEYIETVFWG